MSTPPWASALGLTTTKVRADDGTELAVHVGGPTEGTDGEPAPRLIFLHGFPQHAAAWRKVLPLVLPKARCVVPDLRGYAESELARSDAYDLATLVSDVAVVERATRAAEGDDRAVLVAHDWGGPIAWGAAHTHPELFRHLIAANAPHGGAYAADLQKNPDQRKRSWYTVLFQVPGIERLFCMRDGAGLRLVFDKSSPPGLFSPEEIELYVRPMLRPGRARAALMYYRAAGRAVLTDRRSVIEQAPTEVPVTIVWGQADAALSRAHPEACRAYARELEIRRLDRVSHWVPEERPDAIAEAISDVLEASRSR